ncbi:MAG: hypothetical protein Fues2KO_53620 [Fuerstiella sp.]
MAATTHPPLHNRTERDDPAEGSAAGPIEGFLSNFFQERNIRWILIAGASIVFGSSLMLVTRAWPAWENIPALKFLTILAYTATTWGAAEVGRRRLGLRTTSTVLQLLTLALLPICYLSVQWLSAGRGLQTLEAIGLLIPATAVLWLASAQVFDHLLRGRQTTFLYSYRLLCMAGALPAFAGTAAATTFFFCGWLIFTAGVIKVSRHAFWLAEDHRWPRIFAFVPVLLLAGQFLVLVVTKTVQFSGTGIVSAIQTHWLGFGCVLVAATILSTAKAAADVFRQRTGDLVRPLPWHLAAPLFCGFVTTVAGVLISAVGFHPLGPTTYALIPSAALAAVLMAIAAKESRSSAFVWIALIFAAVAYQCSPTLASDLVRQLKQSVETGIREQRLPLAFYGITYLPFLTVAAIFSRHFQRRQLAFFARPLKHFATVVALLLLALAVTNIKALFVVSAVNIVAFVAFAIVFADRRYVIPAIAALTLTVGSAVPALNGMQVWDLPPQFIATALTALATVLTASRIPDRLLNRIPLSTRSALRYPAAANDNEVKPSLLLQHVDGSNRRLAQTAGMMLAVVMAAWCMTTSALHLLDDVRVSEVIQLVLLLVALLQYHVRRPHYAVGLSVVLLGLFTVIRCGLGFGLPVEALLNYGSIAAAAVSGVAWTTSRHLLSKFETTAEGETSSVHSLRRRLGWDSDQRTWTSCSLPDSWDCVAAALLVPLCDVTVALLAVTMAIYHGPQIVMANSDVLTGDMSRFLPLSTWVTMAWLTIVGLLLRQRIAAAVASIVLPLFLTAAAGPLVGRLTMPWMFCLWSTCAANIRFSIGRVILTDGPSAARSAVKLVSEFWLLGLLLLSCLSFALPLRLAAVVCLGSFFLVDRGDRSDSQRSFLAIAANVQFLLLMAGLCGANGLIVNLPAAEVLPVLLLGTGCSTFVFGQKFSRLDPVIQQVWGALLRAASTLLAMCLLASGFMPPLQIGLTVLALAAAAADEIRQAILKQREFNVWSAFLCVGVAVLFLWLQGVVSAGSVTLQFGLLATAVAALITAHSCDAASRLAIVRPPLHKLGLSLPAIVTLLATGHVLGGSGDRALLLNAMAVLSASAIYFQQAMSHRKRSLAIAAAVTLNVALPMLWSSFGWHQLELVLVPIGLTILGFVQLMKNELPRQTHDPLRYAGALLIFVSPTMQLFGPGWGPSLTLLILSVTVMLLSIGLRLKATLYAGTAFLLADLTAMVLRSHEVYPLLPWVVGIAVGAGLIGLAAFCENHREKLLSRIRLLSAELATWN